MKYLTILLALIACINSIITYPTGDKEVQVDERSVSDPSNTMNSFIKGFLNMAGKVLQALQRPILKINRHMCIWKIYSKPLKQSRKSSKPNGLKKGQFKKNPFPFNRYPMRM